MRAIKIVLLLIAVCLFIASHFVLELPTYETVSESTETIHYDLLNFRIYETPPGQKLTLKFTLLKGDVNISLVRYESIFAYESFIYLNVTENNTERKFAYENNGDVLTEYWLNYSLSEDGRLRVDTLYQRDLSSSNYLAAQLLILAGFGFLILFLYSFRRTVREMDVKHRPIRALGIGLILFGILFFLLFQGAGLVLMLSGIVLMLVGAMVLTFLPYGTRRH